MGTSRILINVLLIGAVLGSPAITFAANCPQVEVAPVAVGGEVARSISGPDGSAIPLQAPLVRSADLTGASMSHAEGQDGLGFNVSPAAGERLRAFTTAHVGAGLAFIIDNRIRKVAKILDPLKGDAFWLSPFPIAEGTALSERVNACIKTAR